MDSSPSDDLELDEGETEGAVVIRFSRPDLAGRDWFWDRQQQRVGSIGVGERDFVASTRLVINFDVGPHAADVDLHRSIGVLREGVTNQE